MATRSIGTATISFGLVSIPIKLFSTNESSSGISFNLLHDKCKGRVKQQYICPKDNNEVVERTNMVKGYEFAKDQYVLFTEEELKALEEQASKAIEITEFVPLSKVDPLYFEKAYYLGPDKGADKSYKLLGEAMRETQRCALAKYAARGKQYLVLLRPVENGIVMQELRYADEVKPMSEVPLGEGEVKEAELTLAKQLINQISTEQFDPKKYKDEVKERTLAQIQRKMQGEAVSVVAEAAPQGKIIDLMEALKASLSNKGSAPVATPETLAAEAAEPERKGPKRAPRKAEAAEKKAK
ncbi:MAG: Ku protein [Deltaproteobacteria bacterium]|nr:Ku protein [Deltaproteobacteria bacterium]